MDDFASRVASWVASCRRTAIPPRTPLQQFEAAVRDMRAAGFALPAAVAAEVRRRLAETDQSAGDS